MHRDTFLKSLGALALLACLPLPGRAGMDVRLMIPANPGGGWDSLGRALGRALQTLDLATVSYENKGGAAGGIGLAQFYNTSRGDPNALMVMGAVMLGGIITSRPPVSLTQLTPIARLITEYNVFVLPPDSAYQSMSDVVAQLRKNPSSIRWGGGSRGSTEHIAVAQIAQAVGVSAAKINYVPFRGGGEATAAILSGNVTVGGSGLSEFARYIASGKMRAIAVTSAQRLPGIAVPTLKEQGIDVEIGNWRGVYAAAGISATERDALTALVVQATRSNAWAETLARYNWTPAVLTGSAFDAFVERDFATLRATMVRAGMV